MWNMLGYESAGGSLLSSTLRLTVTLRQPRPMPGNCVLRADSPLPGNQPPAHTFSPGQEPPAPLRRALQSGTGVSVTWSSGRAQGSRALGPARRAVSLSHGTRSLAAPPREAEARSGGGRGERGQCSRRRRASSAPSAVRCCSRRLLQVRSPPGAGVERGGRRREEGSSKRRSVAGAGVSPRR